MKQRRRIYYSVSQRAEIWDRWQRGESMSSIGRGFERESSSIFSVLSPSGGIRPPDRKRSRCALSLIEREEISRGLVAGRSDTALSTNEIVAQARDRLQASMQGYRQTMRVQAQVVENVQADAGLLSELVSQSQSATGSLQVSQATNQLLALSTKQQLQIQQMMAAQYRADTLERSRQQQALEAARERTRRFIGPRDIYTRD